MSELLNPQMFLIQKWSTTTLKYNLYTLPRKVQKEDVKWNELPYWNENFND